MRSKFVNYVFNDGQPGEVVTGHVLEYDLYDKPIVLGRGKISVVQKCTTRAIDQYGKTREMYCACKIFDKESAKNVKQMQIIQNEINIAKELCDSIYFVRYKDDFWQYFNTTKVTFILYELVSGGNLADFAKQGPHHEYTSRYIADLMLRGAEFMHAKNIAHCNIKPENYLVTTTNINDLPIVKLCSFSSAIRVTDGQITKDVDKANACCSSPEVYSSRIYSKASDIWAIGSTLYYFHSMQYPFFNNGITKDAEAALAEGSYIPLKNVTQEFNSLMHDLLKLDRSTRINAQDALQHKWFELTHENLCLSKEQNNVQEAVRQTPPKENAFERGKRLLSRIMGSSEEKRVKMSEESKSDESSSESFCSLTSVSDEKLNASQQQLNPIKIEANNAMKGMVSRVSDQFEKGQIPDNSVYPSNGLSRNTLVEFDSMNGMVSKTVRHYEGDRRSCISGQHDDQNDHSSVLSAGVNQFRDDLEDKMEVEHSGNVDDYSLYESNLNSRAQSLNDFVDNDHQSGMLSDFNLRFSVEFKKRN